MMLTLRPVMMMFHGANMTDINDNIRHLWNRAASSHRQEATSWATQQSFLTRYTELVIQETLRLVPDRGEHSDGHVLCHRIANHFGFRYDPADKKHSR
jgi:hypothetical protein